MVGQEIFYLSPYKHEFEIMFAANSVKNFITYAALLVSLSVAV